MISKQQFLMWQPAAPQEKSTDTYYLSLANRLAAIAKDKGLFPHYPEKAVERAALALVGVLSGCHMRCRCVAFIYFRKQKVVWLYSAFL